MWTVDSHSILVWKGGVISCSPPLTPPPPPKKKPKKKPPPPPPAVPLFRLISHLLWCPPPSYRGNVDCWFSPHPCKGPSQKFNVASKRKFIAKGGGGVKRHIHTFCTCRTTLIWEIDIDKYITCSLFLKDLQSLYHWNSWLGLDL